MTTIETATPQKTPPANSVTQTVTVHMDERGITPVVHLTQYDQTIPVIAVNAYYSGQPYTIPSGAAVNVRMSKPDGKHVYSPALGASSDRETVYIAVTAQMTAAAGKGLAIIEVVLDGGIVGSAPVMFDIRRNPVPADAYESTDEYKTMQQLAAEVDANAKAAAASAKTAEQHKNAANTAKTGAETAKNDAITAKNAAVTAQGKAETAASNASTSQTAAKAAQTAAETARNAAAASATKAQSYAEGGTGTREGENADNAQYYYEQAKRISQGLNGALLPMGTIKFAALPSEATPGWLYNISDAFTTTSAFVEGAGHAYPAGTNVYRTAENKWDCLAGTQVVSVNSKTGAVVLTAANVGALPTTGGTVTGPVSVNADTVDGTNRAYIGVQNSTGGTYVSLVSSADGSVSVYSSTKQKALVSMTSDGTVYLGGVAGPFIRNAANTVATTNIANGAVTKEKIASGVLTAANVGALPMSGGTLTGTLKVGEKLELRMDGEGGNIRITPPDSKQTTNQYWEVDANTGNLRFYAHTADTRNPSALTLNSTESGTQLNGNAATATKLATARTINNVEFDGTKNITVNVGTDNITASAVTEAKIAANAVVAGKIKDKAVTESKINDYAVTSSKLATLSLSNDIIGVRLIDDGSADATKFNSVGSGLFRWTTALTDGNKPFPSGVGLCIKQTESAVVQLAFATTVATPKFVIRRKKSGTWENWKQITVATEDFERITGDEPMPGPGFDGVGNVDGPSADTETEAKNEQDSESM